MNCPNVWAGRKSSGDTTPIVFTRISDLNFHRETYHRIAEELKGHTNRCIISTVDIYRKAAKRLRFLESKGIPIVEPPEEKFGQLMKSMWDSAGINGINIQSCAESPAPAMGGIPPGKCIDDGLIRHVFGLDVTDRKDPSQRAACGCVVSRDIGVYDTCLFGCVYCYATTRLDRARERHGNHDPAAPSLNDGYRELKQ